MEQIGYGYCRWLNNRIVPSFGPLIVLSPLAAANALAPATAWPGAPLDHFGVTAAPNVAFEDYVIPLPARFLAKGPGFGAARAGFTTRQPRSRSIISA
jgi:hypothetical protein